MNQESVRFLAVWGWPVLENVDINEIYVQKDHWLLKYIELQLVCQQKISMETWWPKCGLIL